MKKKNTPETPEQMCIRKEKERRELARWEREQQRPKTKGYIWYTMAILAMIYVVDEITALIGTQMQPDIAQHLFAGRLSILSLCAAFSLPLMAASMVYKTLADRYGRKLFLCINTLGMGAGLFLTFLAGRMGAISGIVLYVVASMFINFFIPADMQVVYIMEIAPEKGRATMFATIKAVATVGVVLIPAMRSVFMGSSNETWYWVYLVPALVAAAACVIALLQIRESDAFLEQRIRYLKMSDEERAAQADRRSAEVQAQGGIGNALRFSFAHKQLKWLFICTFLFRMANIGTGYHSSIASLYYETAQLTALLFAYPFSSALVTWINGFICDKIGRKLAMAVTSIITLASFVLFYLGCLFGWNPTLSGLFIGAFIGGYYSAGDIVNSIMVSESAPTNLRASITSAVNVMSVLGGMIGAILPLIILFVTGDNVRVLGIACIAVTVPVLAATIFFLFRKIGDTTHVDLNTVRGDEWDDVQ